MSEFYACTESAEIGLKTPTVDDLKITLSQIENFKRQLNELEIEKRRYVLRQLGVNLEGLEIHGDSRIYIGDGPYADACIENGVPFVFSTPHLGSDQILVARKAL